MPGRRSKPASMVGEALMWILFAALLAPAGFVGWAIGHYTGHTKNHTVTVSASARPTTTAAATTAAATTTAAAATGGSAVAAKAIFSGAGCAACHTFKPAGATGKIGPDLDTAPEKDAKKDKMALAAFIKQSIVDPNAYISPGFPKSVMPPNFGSTLGSAKVDELVNYIASDGK
ncbi:MAG: c-type cytochrome [Actinobacteria bacterium]|nr:c-type cytochrome [Actinomycetota bacterium]